MASRYRVIIVGGGVAGLVAAARLSENNPNVEIVVIEAGPDRRGDLNIDAPGLLIKTWGNPHYDWDLWSVPQVRRCLLLSHHSFHGIVSLPRV